MFATALKEARAKIALNHPFFAVLLLNTPVKVTDELPTAAVDGQRMLINPEFFVGLKPAERIGLLVHEVMHLALAHPLRRGGRDGMKWNIACDYVINWHLTQYGLTLPQGALLDDQYAGMSAEDVYAKLPDDPNEQERGAAGFGAVVDPESEDAQQIEADLKRTIAQAAAAAQQAGKMPHTLREAVDQTLEARVPWKQTLQRFLTEPIPADPSWATPARRFVSRGMYLPGRAKESVARCLVVAVDTSGSITHAQLQEFAAELTAVFAVAQPEQLHVIYCDACVQHVDTYQKGEEVVLARHGGGGTAFQPVFDYVEEQGLNPTALVYLTDLYGPMPEPVQYPVLWAVYDNPGTASWGETIHVR